MAEVDFFIGLRHPISPAFNMEKKEYTLEDFERDRRWWRKLKWILYGIIALAAGGYLLYEELARKWYEKKERTEKRENSLKVLADPKDRDFYCFYSDNSKFLAKLDSIVGDRMYFRRSKNPKPHFDLRPQPDKISEDFDAPGAQFTAFEFDKNTLKKSIEDPAQTFELPGMGQRMYCYWAARADGPTIYPSGYSTSGGMLLNLSIENRGLPCTVLKIENTVGEAVLSEGQFPLDVESKGYIHFKFSPKGRDTRFKMFVKTKFNDQIVFDVNCESGDSPVIKRLD